MYLNLLILKQLVTKNIYEVYKNIDKLGWYQNDDLRIIGSLQLIYLCLQFYLLLWNPYIF